MGGAVSRGMAGTGAALPGNEDGHAPITEAAGAIEASEALRARNSELQAQNLALQLQVAELQAELAQVQSELGAVAEAEACHGDDARKKTTSEEILVQKAPLYVARFQDVEALGHLPRLRDCSALLPNTGELPCRVAPHRQIGLAQSP